MEKLPYSQQIIMEQPEDSGIVLPLENWDSHDLGEVAFSCIIGSRLNYGSGEIQPSRYLTTTLKNPINRMLWAGLLLRNPLIELEGEVVSKASEGTYRILIDIILESSNEEVSGDHSSFEKLCSASTFLDVFEGRVRLSLLNGSTMMNWVHAPELIRALKLKINLGIVCIEGTAYSSSGTELTVKIQPGLKFSQIVASNALKVLRA